MHYAVKNSLTNNDIKYCRKKFGLSQAEFAELMNISKKTVEHWEYSKTPITGPVVTLLGILQEYPQLEEALKLPEKKASLRISYMFKDQLCTIIDVDEKNKSIQVVNYTRHILKRAFGRIEAPTYEQYEEFLESRCFPRSRDKMKLILRELELPFYDPFMVIEKTEGRMAEDDFWLKVER